MLGSAAKADQIVYSNLAPGDSFSTDGGWTIQGFDSIHIPAATVLTAVPFTPTDDFILTTIEVGLMWESGVNDVLLTLNASGPDGFPGQVLESWSLSGLPPVDPSATVEEVASSGTEVHAGMKYWLEASPGDSTTAAYWGMNTQNIVGEASNLPDLGWLEIDVAAQGAVQISGVSTAGVPEIDPSSATTALAMLAGGILTLCGRRTKR